MVLALLVILVAIPTPLVARQLLLTTR